MPKEKLSLHMITLWHPNVFLGVEQSEMSNFPVLRRDRETMERLREETAREKKVQIHYDHFHGRRIANLGKPVYYLRKTWIAGPSIAMALQDFDVRLIYTSEQGSQARVRCEFRPNWAGEPAAWEPSVLRRIVEGIASTPKVSIRQLWRNPVKARYGLRLLPLEVPEGSVSEIANLVLGPYEGNSSARSSDVTFEKSEGTWWIVF